MADLHVYFMHPTDGRRVEVTIDNSMTTQEALDELLANDFINPNPGGYTLAIKGGAPIPDDKPFEEAGVKDNDTIRIIPATDAG